MTPPSVTPSFTADKPGTYQAQLVVNDGHTDSAPPPSLPSARRASGRSPTPVRTRRYRFLRMFSSTAASRLRGTAVR